MFFLKKLRSLLKMKCLLAAFVMIQAVCGKCPDAYSEGSNQKCYQLLTGYYATDWFSAQLRCSQIGASLARVKSDDDMTIVKALAAKAGRDVWIDGNDIGSNRTANAYARDTTKLQFYYNDRSVVQYFHFAKSEPDNSKGNEHCLSLYSSAAYAMNDLPCTHGCAFICETNLL